MATRFGADVRARRMRLEITQDELAARCPLHRNTIGRVERDAVTPADVEPGVLVLLARGLGVTVAELLRGSGDEPEPWGDADDYLHRHGLDLAAEPVPAAPASAGPPPLGVPILGRIAAGGLVESQAVDHDNFGKLSPAEVRRLPVAVPEVPQAFALQVDGDSMSPMYLPGDHVLLRNIPVVELRSGEDAMVQLDDLAGAVSAFKRIILIGDGRVHLMPLNPRYDAITVHLRHITRVGRLIGLWRQTPASARRA